jgi:hypothetical protein
MANAPGTAHIPSVDLAAYFAGRLQSGQKDLVEEHFATCGLCIQRARQFHARQIARFQGFSAVWDKWTAAENGRAYQFDILITALRAAERRYPQWQGRLQHWRERWGNRVGGAVQQAMLRTAGAGASRVVIENLETLAFPMGKWQFALAAEPLRPREASGGQGLRVRGLTPTRAAVSLTPQKFQERVTVQSNTGEVQVHVDGWSPELLLPLVVLAPAQEGSQPIIVQEPIEEQTGVLTARFCPIEPGEYLVAFEPVS